MELELSGRGREAPRTAGAGQGVWRNPEAGWSPAGQFHWLLENELPKKYPAIRWAFIEAASNWLPYTLGDVKKRLTRKGSSLSDNPLADNNIWVTTEKSDDIPYIIDRVDDTNLVVGTDYGHTDTSAQIEALRTPKDRDGVSPVSVDKILGPNPTRLYGL